MTDKELNSAIRKLKKICYCDRTKKDLDYEISTMNGDIYADIRDDLVFCGLDSKDDKWYRDAIRNNHLLLRFNDWKSWPNLMKTSYADLQAMIVKQNKDLK